jgi:hypothetical protein
VQAEAAEEGWASAGRGRLTVSYQKEWL